ncbi:hypothetical protein [Persicobacter psychrovividus]|uniref:Uncharacterized protein n=1 Tax=Persicobacter psychrovividus TaxID=387638 RepID=A0ABM7VEG6_9BACT|nr:hypothetical protein PEPS_15950 [Persicobacter psychrovividus]
MISITIFALLSVASVAIYRKEQIKKTKKAQLVPVRAKNNRRPF